MSVVWLCGFWCWRLTQPAGAYDWFERIAYAYPIGAGVAVMGALLLSWAGWPWTVGTVLAPVALLAVAAAIAGRYRTRCGASQADRFCGRELWPRIMERWRGNASRSPERGPILIIVAESALLFASIVIQGGFVDWDAWAIWGFKAKVFFVDQSMDPYLQKAGIYGFSWPARPCFSAIFQAIIY